MNYEDLKPSQKSALLELLFLEELEKVTRLSNPQIVDKNSISSSLAPIKTLIVPKEERTKVARRVESVTMFKKKKK